jgi:Cu/Ag efflux protein CusF
MSCKQQAANQTAVPQASPTGIPINTAVSQPSPITNKPYPGTGVVKLINRKEGWIGIAHEEIPGLMPAMEMEFWVEKKSLLDKVKVGQKVNFTLVDTGKAQIITKLEKASDN